MEPESMPVFQAIPDVAIECRWSPSGTGIHIGLKTNNRYDCRPKQTEGRRLILKTGTRRRRRRLVRHKTGQTERFKVSVNDRRTSQYAAETNRPIVCLAFILPLLFLYEFGSIFTDHFSAKSGVDRWLHQFLDNLGVGHLVILPLITAGALLFLHHQRADKWNFQPQVLGGMLMESCCLGFILYFAGNAFHEFIPNPSYTLSIGDSGFTSCWNRTIAFIGSGVYEELIFRLLLLNGLIWLGSQHLNVNNAKIIGTVATSLVFSLLHYDLFNPNGCEFDIYSFIFRFSASLVFCLLFLFRGFGIAVGTHCTYDVLTQI